MHRAFIAPNGPAFEAPEDTPLLLSAQQAGLEMQSSCRNGTCRSCICSLESGRITYRIEWPGLSAEEKAEGFILPCVAYPLSDVALRMAFRPREAA
ncbi:MAG: 2Fe-2S iron-sulfur cluster binding domain-containing protein [Bdellovibrionales bacterium]|nr:2Fe-2S iron-sulfur cluster binding domain-containing protein [Ramlibacter sp.]